MTLSPILERAVPNEDVNPWLVPAAESSQKTVQKRHEISLSKDSGGAEKSKNKLRKRVKKRDEEKEKAKEDGTVDISMSNVLALDKPAARSSVTSRQATQRAKASDGQDDDSDANSEVEAQEQALNLKGKGRAKDIKAFEQRDLVARAFAGDNVVRVCTTELDPAWSFADASDRNSPLRNVERSTRTLRRKLTQPLLAGLVHLSTSRWCL